MKIKKIKREREHINLARKPIGVFNTDKENIYCNATMEDPSHMAYTPKGLVDDVIGVPLKLYKE